MVRRHATTNRLGTRMAGIRAPPHRTTNKTRENHHQGDHGRSKHPTNHGLETSRTGHQTQTGSYTPTRIPTIHQSIQRESLGTLSPVTTLRPCYRPKTRRPRITTSQSSQITSRRTHSSKRIRRRESTTRTSRRIKESLRRQTILHKKEGWETTPSTRLPQPERSHDKEPLPTTTDPRPDSRRPESSTVHQIRRPMGLQQCTNQKGRRMESRIHHSIRIIRTTRNVLRTNELTRHLPSHDESHLPRRNQGRLAGGIHGRPTHRNQRRPNIPQNLRTKSPSEINGSRPLPQNLQVRIPQTTHRVSRSRPGTWSSSNGPH
jgi:hypothetical protein